MFGGLGPAMNMVEHLKENFRTSFAKKTDVEEIEKTMEILSKFIY
jgi:hypothetical protein